LAHCLVAQTNSAELTPFSFPPSSLFFPFFSLLSLFFFFQVNALSTNVPQVPFPEKATSLPPAPPADSDDDAEESNPFAEDDDDEEGSGSEEEEDTEPWALQGEKDLRWDDVFLEVGAVEGKLAAGPARSALMATGVPKSKLRHIWNLSDIDKDGSLDGEEFAIAMHLCEMVNGGEEAPEVLERGMVPKGKRKKRT